MTSKAQQLDAVILDLRLCFNLLRALGDDLHRDLGVNTSMRAVMESLARGGEQTVPEIARSRSVSRQHIQVIANRLSRAKLIEARGNPADKRTFLVSLSDRGRRLFGQIQQREASEFGRLSRAISGPELQAVRETLQKLNAALVNTGERS